jgi:hypothetical protein
MLRQDKLVADVLKKLIQQIRLSWAGRMTESRTDERNEVLLH